MYVDNYISDRNINDYKFMIFDLETNGLPTNKNLSWKWTKNWPKILQISWGIYNINGRCLKFRNYIIKQHLVLNESSARIHNITTYKIKKYGIASNKIMKLLHNDLNNITHIISHNMNFDKNTLFAELCRSNRYDTINSFETKAHICTMLATIDYCRLHNGRYYKWPKLEELYYKIFRRQMTNKHNAEFDVKNLSKCFFYLIKNGIIRF